MSELKPCPFCGGKTLDIRKGKYMWWIECCNADCGTLGGVKRRKKEAIDAWNRRVGEGEKG